MCGRLQLIAETLNNAALCQYKMGQYKAVVGTSTLLLKSDPTNISALLRRGLVRGRDVHEEHGCVWPYRG